MFNSKFGAHFVKASTPKTTTDSLPEKYVVYIPQKEVYETTKDKYH